MAVDLVYWDSATFLAYFQGEVGRVDLCQGTLDRAMAGEIGIMTSTLAIAECLWLRNAPPVPKDKAELVRRFFRRSCIRVRNVTRSLAETAQDLVWEHGVKPKDAIHVATALEIGVVALETFDDGLLGKNGLIGTPTLLIRKPVGLDQGSLNV